MRPLLREALANLVARRGLTAALVALFAAVLVGLLVAETDATVDVRSYGRRLADQGWTTFLVGRQPQSASAVLTPGDCTGLAHARGVRAALWVGPAGTYRLWAADGPGLQVRRVGGDVAAFIAVADPAAARAWRGEQLLIDRTNPVVAGTGRAVVPLRLLPDDGRAPAHVVPALAATLTRLGGGQQGNALLAGPPTGEVDFCAVVADEDARDAVVRQVRTAFPAARGYTQQWTLGEADAVDAPRARFESRLTRWAWLAGAAALVAVWGLYLRVRRGEVALYAVAGVRAPGLVLLLGAELLVVAAAGVAFTVALAGGVLAAGRAEPADLAVGAIGAARCLVAAVPAAGALVVLAALRARSSTLEGLKDR